MFDKEHIDVVWLGQILGQASGWDGDKDLFWWVYDFEPEIAYDLTGRRLYDDYFIPPCHRLCFDMILGTLTAEDDEGMEIGKWATQYKLVTCRFVGMAHVPNPFYDFFEQD